MNLKWNFKSLLFYITILMSIVTFFTGANAALPAGTKLPAFTLKSLNNKDISLEDFKGKVIVLHLWKCQ